MSSAQPASDEDLLIAKQIGHKIFANVISSIMESLTWGAYLVLFIFAMTIHRKRGMRSTGNKLMLFVTILLFSSSTVLWTLNVTWTLKRVRTVLMERWDLSWADRIVANGEELAPLGTPMEALFMLNMLVGDAVVVTRAKVLWSGNWKIIAIPCLMLFTALVFSVLGIICVEIEGFGQTSAIVAGSYVCRRAEPIAWALSIITNGIATALIAYKAWEHRSLMRSAGLEDHPTTQVEKVLSLMIESGFAYILLLGSQFVVFWEGVAPMDPSAIAWAVLSPLGDQITGMYATGIIVLVALQRTYWAEDEEATSTQPSTSRSRSIRFAHPVQSTYSGLTSQPPLSSGKELPIELVKTTTKSDGSRTQIDSKPEFDATSAKSSVTYS